MIAEGAEAVPAQFLREKRYSYGIPAPWEG